jgi:hypothetical protein
VNAEIRKPDDAPAAWHGVRWLTPEDTRIFQGTYSLLHCQVTDLGLFRGVYAAEMFPVSHPERFVSLRYTDAAEKVQEIGIVEDLAAFPEDAKALVRASLLKQSYEKEILEIHEVREDLGFLFFYVRTNEGWEKFVMPWRSDRTEELSEHGKVLLDAFDNRYVIPDLGALTPADRRKLTAYVYW